MKADKKEIGRYLAQLRKSRRLSARQLAKQSGVSQAYISQIERGVYNNPQPDILEKLAKALDVSQMELLIQAGIVKEKDQLGNAIESNITKLVKRKNKALKTEKNLKFIKSRIEEIRDIIEYTSNSESKEELIDRLTFLTTEFENQIIRTGMLMEEIAILQEELDRHMKLYKELNSKQRDIDINEVLTHSKNITFNGKTLTYDDRVKLYDMMNVLFG